MWHECLSSSKKKVSSETCVCNIFSLAHCKKFSLTLDLNIRTVDFFQLFVLSFLIIALCLQETVGWCEVEGMLFAFH